MSITATVTAPPAAPTGRPFHVTPDGVAPGYYQTVSEAAAAARRAGAVLTSRNGTHTPAGYVDLPGHTVAVRPTDGACVCTRCGAQLDTQTYAEYVAWWTSAEYEGEPGHTPGTPELYAYTAGICLADGTPH